MKIQKRLFLLLIIPLLTSVSLLQAETVTIDFQKVYEEYVELKIEDQKLREEVALFQREQQAKAQALQAKQEDFNLMRSQAAQPELADEERKALVIKASEQLETLNREEQELRQERTQFQRDLEAKGLRLRRGIVDKVNVKVTELAKENGWEIVLDSSAKTPAGLSVVAYASKAVDRTELVIMEMNNAAKVKPEAAE